MLKEKANLSPSGWMDGFLAAVVPYIPFFKQVLFISESKYIMHISEGDSACKLHKRVTQMIEIIQNGNVEKQTEAEVVTFIHC